MIELSEGTRAVLARMDAEAKAEVVDRLPAIEARLAPVPLDSYSVRMAGLWLRLARHCIAHGHWSTARDFLRLASRHATTARRRFDRGLADRGRKGWR